MKTTGFVAIFIIALIATGAAMPMSSCTPEQAAAIMVQPIKDTVTGYHDALVSGDITENEYITLLYLQVQIIRVKVILLDILMVAEMSANEFGSALFDILPWRVR
jgi:hypothetical protein